jgi:phage gpG-like protein
MSNESGLFGDWEKAIQLLENNPVKKAVNIARKQIGVRGVSMVKKGIVDGAPGGQPFTPLLKWTKDRKHSSKPLIDHGDLLGSITHEVVGNGDVWIGARRGVRTQNGQDIVNIAAVHEFGTVIDVTPKMRAYLHYVGLHLNPATTHIHIPPRSFLRATLESDEFKKEIGKKITEAMKKALNIA